MWNMARNTEKAENEKHTLQDLEYARKLTNEENEKLIWQDMKYGEKH